METIGHHTCKNDGGKAYILDRAPFKSPITKTRYADKIPFLGEGYYYWENDIELAHWWGEQRCKGRYCIIESRLDLKNEIFFDLVGNRTHMLLLLQRINFLEELDIKAKDLSLGAFIELLKKLNKSEEYKNIFPYKAIRAVDMSKPIREYKKFTDGLDNFTDLAPKLIICLIDKKDILLDSEIIFLN